jgi:2-enoate reductase
MSKSGIKVELGKEASARSVAAFKPDAVVIATGSVVHIPAVPGADKSNVVTAIDVLLGKESPGEKTLLVGGGAIGCETALYLAQQGKKVTVVEMLPEVCSDVVMIKGKLTVGLADSGVEVLPNVEVVGIDDDGVTATAGGKDTVNIKGDKVALALGLVADSGLYEELKREIPEIYLIGDATEPGRVGQAVHDGYRVGAAI